MIAGLLMDFLSLKSFLTLWILEVNLDETNCLKDFLAELTLRASPLRASYPKSCNVEIKF